VTRERENQPGRPTPLRLRLARNRPMNTKAGGGGYSSIRKKIRNLCQRGLYGGLVAQGTFKTKIGGGGSRKRGNGANSSTPKDEVTRLGQKKKKGTGL